VVANDQGQLRTYKTDSTPGDLAVGVVEGLRLAAAMRPAHLSQNTGGQRLLPMGEYLEVVAVDNRIVLRCKCGSDLGDADKNWKERAAVVRVGANVAGPRRKLHEDLEMVEFLCPACGTLLSVDVKKKEDPFIVDAMLSTKLLRELITG